MAQDRPTISTHVLDTAAGAPRAGVPVRLRRVTADGATPIVGDGVTDADGRIRDLLGGGRSRPGPTGWSSRWIPAGSSPGWHSTSGSTTPAAATTCRCCWRPSVSRRTAAPEAGRGRAPGDLGPRRARRRCLPRGARPALRGRPAVPGPAVRGPAVPRRRAPVRAGAHHRAGDARAGAARADRRPPATRSPARSRVPALLRRAGIRPREAPRPPPRTNGRASQESSAASMRPTRRGSGSATASSSPVGRAPPSCRSSRRPWAPNAKLRSRGRSMPWSTSPPTGIGRPRGPASNAARGVARGL